MSIISNTAFKCLFKLPVTHMYAGQHPLEELVAGGELLPDHAGHGDHGEAAVVDLLGLLRVGLGLG